MTLTPPSSPLPQPGDRVGRFEVLRELARGGMGVVFVALDTTLGRNVALKLQLPDAGAKQERRFTIEAQALARIQHPNVVRVHAAGYHGPYPYDRAADLADDLKRYLAGEPVLATRRIRIGWRRVATPVFGVCLALLLLFLALWTGPREAARAEGKPPLVLRVSELPHETFAEALQLEGSLALAEGDAAQLGQVWVKIGAVRRRVRLAQQFRVTVPLTVGTNEITVSALPADGRPSTVLTLQVLRRPAPTWFLALKGSERPPRLPRGLTPTKTAGEYLNHIDRSILVWIPPPVRGFRMGRKADLAQGYTEPVHTVRLRQGFFLGKYEVSNEQFARFRRSQGRSHLGQHDLPVGDLNWVQATAYCAWAGLRLPTEAEWEWAAKGPRDRPYPWGPEPPNSKRANYDPSRDELRRQDVFTGRASTVGSHEAGRTPRGLHHMAGNMGEWVWDWQSHYPADEQVDPHGSFGPGARVEGGRLRFVDVAAATLIRTQDGAGRVVRGGSFNSAEGMLQSTYRYCYPPEMTIDNLGFRVCLSPGPRPQLPALRWGVRVFSLPNTGDAPPAKSVWNDASQGGVAFVTSRLDFLNARWGPPEIAAKLRQDYFGTLATAQLTIPAGRWLIGVHTDNGIRLLANGVALVDGWNRPGTYFHSAELLLTEPLTADLRIEHYEGRGGQALSIWLTYQGPP